MPVSRSEYVVGEVPYCKIILGREGRREKKIKERKREKHGGSGRGLESTLNAMVKIARIS